MPGCNPPGADSERCGGDVAGHLRYPQLLGPEGCTNRCTCARDHNRVAPVSDWGTRRRVASAFFGSMRTRNPEMGQKPYTDADRD